MARMVRVKKNIVIGHDEIKLALANYMNQLGKLTTPDQISISGTIYISIDGEAVPIRHVVGLNKPASKLTAFIEYETVEEEKS